MLASVQVAVAQPLFWELGCPLRDDGINDPYYCSQWHLKNTGTNLYSPVGNPINEDINIEPVWRKGYLGKNLKRESYISIVDGDVQLDHPDLKDNISTKHSVDFYPNEIDRDDHGTSVAGIVAARANNIGVRGVAPLAKIYSLNILGSTNTRITILLNQSVKALTHHASMTTVSNNSWGYPAFVPAYRVWQMAVETGISKGFYGKGTVYVFSAGNDHCLLEYRQIDQTSGRYQRVCNTDNANYDGQVNYHAVIAVCAVDYRGHRSDYSESGANLWVCAPSRDQFYQTRTIGGISIIDLPVYRNSILTATTTTNITNRNNSRDYTTFGGTSAATPMVSGVVALMREANPNLSWRDVKLILANSARKNDTTDSGWATGATKYGAFTGDADEKYNFNHQYGFGVANAAKAVDLAEQWINLPPREPNTWAETDNVGVLGSVANSSIFIQSDISFIEYLDIRIALENYEPYNTSIKLTSPSGAVSELAVPSDAVVPLDMAVIKGKLSGVWQFGSAKHLGEDPTGNWRITFENTRGPSGTMAAWGINVRGYQVKMDVIAAEDLSESNVENNPLTLTLSGAQWKKDLQPSDLILRGAPTGLSIGEVFRTSDTSVRLSLILSEGFDYDRRFQVAATTGTVSNYAKSLVSDDIEILADIVPNPVAASDGLTNSEYNLSINLDDIFGIPGNLSYLIRGLEGSGLTTSTAIINGRNVLNIGGVPTIPGNYRVYITAVTPDGHRTTTFFTIGILLDEIRVQIKIFLEGVAE